METETALRQNDRVVQLVSRSISDGQMSFRNLPGLIKRMIEEDMWKRRVLVSTGEIVEFERFTDFVTTSPVEGLGTNTAALLKICAEDTEVYEMVDRMIKSDIPEINKHGENKSGVRITNSSDTTEYSISRLKRDRPDLAERVINGELSPNAAAIEAGFRKRRISIPVGDVSALADVVLKTLTLEQRIELAAAILPTSGKDDTHE